MQSQYLHQIPSTNLNDGQYQLDELRILCNGKDRQVSQIECLWNEYKEQYEMNLKKLKNQLELNQS